MAFLCWEEFAGFNKGAAFNKNILGNWKHIFKECNGKTTLYFLVSSKQKIM